MSDRRQGVLAQAWLILLLAAGFGAALAGVEVGWGGRIEANKRAEILRRIPALVLGAGLASDAEIAIRGELVELTRPGGESLALSVEERDLGGYSVYEVSDKSTGARAGWVVRASDQGYADTIELLVGLSSDGGVVTGLYVLSQKETPGLGDAIRGEKFRRQFSGQPTNSPLEVARAPSGSAREGEIVALTAATISSRSVCDIVNRAVADFGDWLEEIGAAK